MADIVDKSHLENGIWKTLEAHLWRLEHLVAQLKETLEAKDVAGIGAIGEDIVESGIEVVSDTNAITVLDCLGKPLTPLKNKTANTCPKCGNKIRIHYDFAKGMKQCLDCGHVWK